VLLISPVRELDPPCGDVTYTEVLVKHPPAGVQYETYDSALKRGTLVEHANRARLAREPLLTLVNKGINILRGARMLFWEPFRFFSVRSGEYDLVHLHVFNARFIRMDCPLVISCGAPQGDVYRDRREYSASRVYTLEQVEHSLARIMGMNCNSYRMPQAARVWVYTEYYRDFLLKNGYMKREQVSVIPIMSVATPGGLERRMPKRVGFVARDFDLKGGPTVVKAFEKVRHSKPEAELWIVGSPPQMSEENARRRGIKWIPVVERDVLLKEIMPSFDIFAYPTPHDCFSYVMLEAMSCGAAIATSDYVSMPEAVDYGKAGMISPVGDAEKLGDNILKLLEPEVNWTFRERAKRRFIDHFSWEAVAPRMAAEYAQVAQAYRMNRDRALA
jgi:glycosyltransferase involved in cell wall biosynthesis